MTREERLMASGDRIGESPGRTLRVEPSFFSSACLACLAFLAVRNPATLEDKGCSTC
jgi:hypothetical protein